MEQTKYCAGVAFKSGRPCRNAPMKNSDFCQMHDMSPKSLEFRYQLSKKGGKHPHSIVSKLKGVSVNDSADIAKALLTIIQEIFARGDVRTTKDMTILNGLVKTYSQLEKDSIIPKKMKEIELWFEQNKQSISSGQIVPVPTRNPQS
ncbi:MAG: hypothetical protein ACD_19C00139G0001 [uncultured bacterium]|nr:MAG: hypothetical protein ACD_19C00139G0001 [uncultured bacterium]